MALTTMYAAQTNSPTTTLASAAGAADTSLIVTSAAVLPSTTPFELSLGIGEAAAETVLVTAVNGNTLTVTRGWDGTPQAWAVNTVCARTFSARDLNDMQANITALAGDLNGIVDDTLSVSGKAADAAVTGSAIFRTKSRTTNYPAAFTWWESSADYSSSNPASPANMPINSYTYATGATIAGFNNADLTLVGSRSYMVYCWASLHNAPTRLYFIFSPAYNEFFAGRSTNSGASVTWTNWSPKTVDSAPTENSTNLVSSGGVYAALPVIDAGLSVSGEAADAAATGSALYRTKDRADNMPAALTWWEATNDFSAQTPAGPADMPINSYTIQTGAVIAGFNNDGEGNPHGVFTLASTSVYAVVCLASLHSTAFREYFIFSGRYCYHGRKITSGFSGLSWSDWTPARPKSASVMFFGDSIVRGSTGSSQSANRIPDIAGAELGVRCENFGIGNIGWLNTGGTNKTNAIGYLQRVGDDTFYDPSDGWNGYKFLGKGNWSDFNAIVISLGINDGSYPLGNIDTDIITAGLDAMSYADIMALTPTKIVTAMYQCYRYIRNISSTINIIISDPLISKGNSGVPPLWSYNANIGSGSWSRMDLCELNAAFCQRYGLGHITNFDAPIDRVDITNSLADNVHPKSATYAALGLHFAGKIGALIL